MYLIFLLLFCINLQAMKKSDAIEIPFSQNPRHKADSAVFIDEQTIAIVGKGRGFIIELITQQQDDFAIPQLDNTNYSNVCINESRALLGYICNGRPCIYNIKTKATTDPFNFYSYRNKVTLGFNATNDLIALENGNYSAFNPDGRNEWSGSIFLSKPISYHLKNNVFLCCSKESGFDYIDIKHNITKSIFTFCSCQQVNISPCDKFVVIRNNRNSIFTGYWSNISNRCEDLPVKKIASKGNHYFTFAFYPKNNFLVLLNTQGSLEYRNYTNPDKIIVSQQVINEAINPTIKSIIFSPKGSKAMIIINNKCLLLDVPLDIQYPNGWIIYNAVKKYNIPKEIFFIIMDLVSILSNK